MVLGGFTEVAHSGGFVCVALAMPRCHALGCVLSDSQTSAAAAAAASFPSLLQRLVRQCREGGWVGGGVMYKHYLAFRVLYS